MAHPSPPPRDFKVVGGGKGEVKPPKCPTRHPRVGGLLKESSTITPLMSETLNAEGVNLKPTNQEVCLEWEFKKPRTPNVSLALKKPGTRIALTFQTLIAEGVNLKPRKQEACRER